MTSIPSGEITGDDGINSNDYIPGTTSLTTDENQINGRILMIVSCVLLGITFSVGVLGNVLVCISVYTNKALRTPNNALLVNLAIADLLTCVFSVPILLLVYATSITTSDCPESRKALCTVQMFFHISSSSIQLFTLASISMERYQAIARPFKTKEQKWRVIACLIVTWTAGILLGLMTTLFLRNNPIYLFCTCEKSHRIPAFDIVHVCVLTPLGLICLAIVLFFYGKIFEIVRKHVRDKGSLFKRKSEIDRKCLAQADERSSASRGGLFKLPSWIAKRRNKVQDSSQTKAPQNATKPAEKTQPISIQGTLHGESYHHNGSILALDNVDKNASQSGSLAPDKGTHMSSQSLAPDKGTHIVSDATFSHTVTRMEEDDSMMAMMTATLHSNARVESLDFKDSETGENILNDNASDIDTAVKDSPKLNNTNLTPGVNKTVASSISLPVDSNDGADAGKTISLPTIPATSSSETNLPGDEATVNKAASSNHKVDSLPVRTPKPDSVERSPSTKSLKIDSHPEISTSTASNALPNVEDIHGSVCVYNPKSKKTKERGRRNIEAKTAKRASYIIGVFTLCWFPFFIETFVNIFIYISVEVEALILSVAVLSAALNPIAYTVVNQQFRKEFLHNVRVITTLPRLCGTTDDS